MCRSAAATPPVPRFVRSCISSMNKGLPMWRVRLCHRGWRARLGKARLCVPKARFMWARRHHLNESPTFLALVDAPRRGDLVGDWLYVGQEASSTLGHLGAAVVHD